MSNSKNRDTPGLSKLSSVSLAGTLLMAIGAAPAHAQEACVACEAPAAVYRCTVEKSDKLARFGGTGDKALQHVCAKEMARQGNHEKCSVRRDSRGAQCDGVQRMITIASLLESDQASPAPEAPSASSASPMPAASVSTKVEPSKPATGGTQPPRTVQELAERTGETSKQQLKDTGESLGDTAQRTWTCLSTLFQKC